MRYLKDCALLGNMKFVEEVKKHFGDVYLGEPLPNGTPILRITTVLPNFYCVSSATVEKDPLYVVVPESDIQNIWPGNDFDEVRFGTATTQGGQVLTSAVAVFKGTTGLYLCISPRGKAITDIGALGI